MSLSISPDAQGSGVEAVIIRYLPHHQRESFVYSALTNDFLGGRIRPFVKNRCRLLLATWVWQRSRRPEPRPIDEKMIDEVLQRRQWMACRIRFCVHPWPRGLLLCSGRAVIDIFGMTMAVCWLSGRIWPTEMSYKTTSPKKKKQVANLQSIERQSNDNKWWRRGCRVAYRLPIGCLSVVCGHAMNA